MSNHSGGYMLNDVLHVLEREQIFEHLGKERTQKLLIEVCECSRQYDCNTGEILEGISKRYELCYCCLTDSKNIVEGLCPKCGGFDLEMTADING